MKKYLFFLIIPFLFWGCQKTIDSTIDNTPIGYQVISISSYDTVFYAPDDSLLLMSIKFNSISGLKNTYADIYNSAGDKLNNVPVTLYDNGNSENGDKTKGDKIYSNLFPMSKTYPVGNYKINYFVTDLDNNTRKVAENDFIYNNGQNNVAPVISNLIAPDSVQLMPDSVLIPLHITVSDSNGLSDIQNVFFNSFIPPDYHPSSGNPFTMYDDGDPHHGDQTAHDGIYSLIVILYSNAPKGVFRFEFQARDRGHLLSNKIIHNITVY